MVLVEVRIVVAVCAVRAQVVLPEISHRHFHLFMKIVSGISDSKMITGTYKLIQSVQGATTGGITKHYLYF